MTNSTTKKNISSAVDAWIADKKTASRIPNSDLDTIQRRFDIDLEIVRMKDGGVAIYTNRTMESCPEFEDFMARHTPFQKQRIDKRKI